MENSTVLLTEWSEGSGCGCKIAPAVLEQILQASGGFASIDSQLLVGNSSKDDAAVYQVSEEIAVINTVDFFTPIVDDAFDFGRISATNAISDVYAMGGKPLFANAILCWPVEKLSPELAAKALAGAKQICKEAGIELAGGHSIAGKDPVFGLSVTGMVHPRKIKKNEGSKEGDLLFLTKPLGLGVMATAIKRKKITPKEYHKFLEVACQLNRIGEILGNHEEVHAITDVTGFGLLGHALEMAEGADLSIQLYFQHLPLLEGVREYIHGFVFPDNTYRNWNAFQGKVSGVQGMDLVVLCDPQTSGGLLISVAEENLDWFETTMALHHQSAWKVGKFIPKGEFRVQVVKD